MDVPYCSIFNFFDKLRIRKFFFFASKFTGTQTKINWSYSKFRFCNSSINPCSSEEEFKNCYGNCLLHEFKKHLTTCRLPFTKINLPLCGCSNDTHELYGIINKLIKTTDPITHCFCRRRCEQLIFAPFLDTVKTEDQKTVSITLELTNDEIDIYEEQFTYDFIALLSDFGGNLGLFLGLSVITLPEFIWYSYYILINIRKVKPTNKICHVYDACKKNIIESEGKTKGNGVLVKLKSLLVILNAVFTLYLLLYRLNYYLDEPVTIVVKVVQRQYTQYPSVTICAEKQNDPMDEARSHILKQTNKTCDSISPWQLISANLSLKDVWNELNVDGTINLDNDMAEKVMINKRIF
uniref:Uncharacterized protein n=1 Tax=Strigamia maritima TaxID=126957 RepID=T1JGJ4_STRMM